MKLVNFEVGNDSVIRLGIVVDGWVFDTHGHVAVSSTDEYLNGNDDSRRALERFAQAVSRLKVDEPARGVYREDEIRFLPPVIHPGKIIAAGRNFRGHLTEAKEKRGVDVGTPSVPTGFIKASSTLVGHRRPILVPRWVESVDYESELVLVIGKAADGISEQEALSHVAGFTVGNDVSARELQRAEKEAGGGSCAGKNVRTFGPMGPYLVTTEEIPDPLCVRVWARVNGKLRQEALTTDMVHDIRKLVAWYSQIGLDAGDMIMSGTPAGVGLAGKGFLKPGDIVQCGVDGVGVLENPVLWA
jgi:2-keto-4-pentenoate hydratase/2-oxohepta-3-ene-1,7-dioic acid hydratase in catechol pathway